MANKTNTIAELVVSALAANGVKRIFGVPGGGSSLDIIAAAAAVGIDFVLTRSENSAVMMAAATAELDGVPGVALTTKGPGVANAVNGIAYAALDRAPVILLTDGFTAEQESFITHQVFDQRALLDPLVKAFARIQNDTSASEISALIEMAVTPPLGPIQIELTGKVAKSEVLSDDLTFSAIAAPATIDNRGVATAAEAMKNAVRPLVIVGLEARDDTTAAAIN